MLFRGLTINLTTPTLLVYCWKWLSLHIIPYTYLYYLRSNKEDNIWKLNHNLECSFMGTMCWLISSTKYKLIFISGACRSIGTLCLYCSVQQIVTTITITWLQELLYPSGVHELLYFSFLCSVLFTIVCLFVLLIMVIELYAFRITSSD